MNSANMNIENIVHSFSILNDSATMSSNFRE